MGQHGIIIITKGEPLAAAMLQAKVARSADARIGLFQHPDAAIFLASSWASAALPSVEPSSTSSSSKSAKLWHSTLSTAVCSSTPAL